MNRREAIKAGIAAALAPVVAVGAVKRLVIRKKNAMGFTEADVIAMRDNMPQYGRSSAIEAIEEIYMRQGLERAWIKAHSKVGSEILKKAI